MQRSSGVLMPLSSLPSPYGIGSMGKEAYRFVDFLKAGGQTYWQLLPLCPTGAGDSPYSSFSTFAGNPYFIDLDTLIRDRLLKKAEVEAVDWGKNAQAVDYGKLNGGRAPLLRKAYERGRDKQFRDIFRRADEAMYRDKTEFYRLVRFLLNYSIQFSKRQCKMHTYILKIYPNLSTSRTSTICGL